ncbi:MAG: heme exporter protein CcmB [Anaplasmataceae bacterium]|nr:heme exporter protein CcmB [Anaplasmataceae bacterium]
MIKKFILIYNFFYKSSRISILGLFLMYIIVYFFLNEFDDIQGCVVIYISVIFCITTNNNIFFYQEYEKSIIEQYIFTRTNILHIAINKVICFWLIYVLPIIIFASISYGLLSNNIIYGLKMLTSMILSTPIISVLTCMGSAIGLGQEVKIFNIINLLILLLSLPVTILGITIIINNNYYTNDIISLFALLLFIIVPASFIAIKYLIDISINEV